FASPVQTEQLKDPFLIRSRLTLPQPRAGALDTGRELLLAPRPAVMLDRLNRQRGCTDVAPLERRTRDLVEPAAVRRLNRDQVMDHPIRLSARRDLFGNETEQMVTKALSRLRVKEGLNDVLVSKDRVREFAERVDLFLG